MIALSENNPYEAFHFKEWWGTLNTSFISFYFIGFVGLLLIIYWVLPRKTRWIVLLAASLLFYSIAGLSPLLMTALATCITWCCGLCIGYLPKEKKGSRRCILWFGTISILCILIYCKLYGFFEWKYGFIIPLGISYYTFSSIGYLADVYWQKEEPERNYFRLLLFVLFFPKILEGPISKHRFLAPQLCCKKSFDYNQFSFGLQRALWGYFKKMVIADRFSILSSTIFGNYTNYQGQVFVFGVLASVVQLYCDFSGCMDIALGISECFGITVEENFKRPFFSKNAAEFWRRWHISLGTWFKDYIYMPIAVSPHLIRIVKWAKAHWGARVSKAIMSIVPLMFVWVLTGLWHGTGTDYLVWGCYWGILIILSTVFSPELSKLSKIMHIPLESKGWNAWRVIRTLLLFCVGRLFTICGTGNLDGFCYTVTSIFSNCNIWIWFDKTIYSFGLDLTDFWIGVIGLAILWCVEIKQEKGVKIRETLSKKPFSIRVFIYVCAVLAILVFGMYGPGYDSSSFVYMQF